MEENDKINIAEENKKDEAEKGEYEKEINAQTRLIKKT